MLENGLWLTGDDAESLTQAIADVKARALESGVTLDDTQALRALIASVNAGREETEKETRHTYLNQLGKRIVLGTVIAPQANSHI